MKRTPLTRKTQLKKTRMKRKRRKGDKPEVRYEFASQHQSCALTWARAGQFAVVLDPHHLVAGAGRRDDPRNLLVLSRESHDHYHFGGWLDENDKQRAPLTPGHLMWCKRECDVENYDPQYIAGLLGRKELPEKWEPTRPPAWVFQERERNNDGILGMDINSQRTRDSSVNGQE